jgi:bifunctional oligoribonuclease and PAP phosphatase NrnA
MRQARPDILLDIVRLVGRADRILLMCHVDPDGDAIGAILGLGLALARLNKHVVTASPNRVPSRYSFLPGVEGITTHPAGDFDLFISLDCSDAQRLKHLHALVTAANRSLLINIDHHVTNVNFGQINWVDAQAAATAEMIIQLVDALGVTIDQELALPLLTGIVTDTRGFHTPNTGAPQLQAASRLIDAGVSLADVMERTLNVRPYTMIRLWGKMLDTAILEGRIVWAVLTPQMQVAGLSYENGDGGFINLLTSTREADVGVLFHDKGNGHVEVGFRSKPGISIAEVALRLGGGGHAQAAGCTLNGSLVEVQQTVLAVLREAISDQKPIYG